jgi:hypothetical protein
MSLLKPKRAPLIPVGNLYEKRSANGNVFYSGQLIVSGVKIGVLVYPARSDAPPDQKGQPAALTLLADADELDIFEALTAQRIDDDHPF